MAVTIYRGEKNVGELADKLFTGLSARQRDKTEAALLKANPQLAELSTLRAGAILHVPNLPELRAKARRARENPADQIAVQLSTALSAFDKHLTQHHAAAAAAVEETDRVLADKALAKLIGQDKTLQEVVQAIGKANAARKQDLAERGKQLREVLGKLKGEL